MTRSFFADSRRPLLPLRRTATGGGGRRLRRCSCTWATLAWRVSLHEMAPPAPAPRTAALTPCSRPRRLKSRHARSSSLMREEGGAPKAAVVGEGGTMSMVRLARAGHEGYAMCVACEEERSEKSVGEEERDESEVLDERRTLGACGVK